MKKYELEKLIEDAWMEGYNYGKDHGIRETEIAQQNENDRIRMLRDKIAVVGAHFEATNSGQA